MFILKMTEHSIEPERGSIVEIWNDKVFMGAIYPTEKGIKVISKYIAENPEAAIKIDRGKLIKNLGPSQRPLVSMPAILINLI